MLSVAAEKVQAKRNIFIFLCSSKWQNLLHLKVSGMKYVDKAQSDM
jgi:hypothetical protein